MLSSLLSATAAGSVTLTQFLLCTLVSIALGAAVAGFHMFRNQYSKSFILTLALLPAIVQTVIMLVNGDIGTGLAVAGTFSLVRFRSLPGSAREIGSLFLAVAVGLATGCGYLGIAALLVAVVGIAGMILQASSFGSPRRAQRDLRVTVPETLQTEGAFTDLFKIYTASARLVGMRTTNMGSLYELHYAVEMRPGASEKEFIDALRTRNGNLEIVLNTAGLREDLM